MRIYPVNCFDRAESKDPRGVYFTDRVSSLSKHRSPHLVDFVEGPEAISQKVSAYRPQSQANFPLCPEHSIECGRQSFRQCPKNINLIFLADILEALEIGRYRFA